jgi:hypothetical protein
MVILSNYGHWGMTVTGSREDLNRFIATIRGTTEFDFDKVIPVPANQPKEYRHILGGGSYQYEPDAWGSSNAFDVHVHRRDDEECHLQWAAVDECWPVLERLVALFPALRFDGSYADDDSRIYITFVSRDGELVSQEGDYDQAFPEDNEET